MLFDGFQTLSLSPAGARLHVRMAGSGPALLLLHGHPQTQAMWQHVAPALARDFTVVLADLRGYGRSERVAASRQGPPHLEHSKRAMAQDMHALMAAQGFARYAVLAHDRGARVAHRLALDQPQAVQRLMLLDIAPTLAMYEGTTEAFARAYWHWFFLIQPAPLPERLIEADPEGYLKAVMHARFANGAVPFTAAAWADYVQAIRLPGTAHTMCEDYRAAAGIDLEHDRASRAAGERVACPLRVLWGAQGVIERCFDALALWREAAVDAEQVSGLALPCGHYIAEEVPALLLAEAQAFFAP